MREGGGGRLSEFGRGSHCGDVGRKLDFVEDHNRLTFLVTQGLGASPHDTVVLRQ